MRRFALSCEYAHPYHSLILDLCGQHWQDVFKYEGLEELFTFGKLILRSQPKELDDLLDQLKKLTSASDTYKFVQRLDYAVEKEQLKVWLATLLMPTARLFIHGKNKNMLDLMETDKLYLLWGFINSVFWDSPVQAISKEKGSMAKADARNRKRLLSAMKDGQMKMAIVMKVMLLRVAKTTNARLTDIRILSYNISDMTSGFTVL
ncbi:hypothetical protein G6F37_002426 [Rhizopus arrhizus]|nr:hypothetical protein G6F38_009969 [Rhizopus arrhizus]KAG1162148.1 hypothetical protein G6F37_002426 [Rhizopus arrhizus]